MLRKKWLSFLVAVSMVAAMLPTTAFAEGDAVQVGSMTTVMETATGENEQQNTEGEKSAGETSEEEKSEGETPDEGEKSDDETSEEEKSEGEKSEGEVSEEEKSDDGKSEGEVSEEEKAEGETNEGETNEDKTPAETPVTPAPETPVADNGIATMAKTYNVEKAVEMNGQQYATVMDAIAAVENSGTATINLLEDSYEDKSVKIDGNKTITINMNGHAIHVTRGAGSTGTETSGMQFINGSTVIIQNGTLTSEVDLAGWFIKNYCDLTLDKVTINSEKFAAGGINHCGATLQLNNCTMGPGKDGAYAVQMGNYHTGNTIAIIDGGTYSGIANETGYWDSDQNNVRNAIETTIRNAKVEKVGTVSYDPFYDNSVMTVELDCTVNSVEGYAAQINNDGAVNYYASVTAAYEAAETGDTITLCQSDSNVELDSKLVLNKEGVTLDLNGNTVTASENFVDNSGSTPSDHPHLVEVTANNVTIKNGTLATTNKNEHTVHVYRANDVRLEDLTIDNSNSKQDYYGYPLVVNGAQVTLAGDMKFVPKNDFGMNIDGNGQTAALTFAEGAKVDFGGKSGIKADNDKSTDSITFENGVEIANYQELVTGEKKATLKIDGIENTNIDTSKLGYAASVNGTYYNTFAEAYWKIGEKNTVTLYDDVTLDSMLTINKTGVTFDLNGHTISPSGAFKKKTDNNQNHLIDITADDVTFGNGTLEAGSNNNHTLNVWNAQNVTLNGLTLDNADTYDGAPLIVGASDVTLEGNVKLITGENSWYGMNVDSRKVGNTNTGASLTLDSANVAVTGPKTAGIYVENSAGDDVALNFQGTPAITGEAEGFVPVQYAVDKKTGKQNANATLNFNTTNGFDISKCGFGATVTVDNNIVGFNSFEDAFAYVNGNPGAANSTIKLYKDVQLDSTLVINTEGLTLDLNGHTISGLPGFSTTNGSRLVDVLANNVTIKNGTLQAGAGNKHTLNLYEAQNVTLDGLTIDGSQAGIAGAPLVLGGSTAKLEGTTTVKTNKDKSWYGINVDSKNQVGSELTVNGQLIFSGENQNNVGIWVENMGGAAADAQKVTFGTGSSVQGNGVDGFKVIHIEKDADKPQGIVDGAANAGLITDKDGNYVVKPAPAPQPQQPAGGSSHKHNYTWQHSDDEHWQYCADCGQAISNGPHTLQWKDGYQECTVCGYRVGSSTAAAPAAQASAPAAAAPAAPAAPAAAAIPQTGDASNPMLWVVLLAVSGSALGALVYTKKKREE